MKRALPPAAVLAFLGALLLAAPLSEPKESPLGRALSKVRRQDYAPIFDLAGARIAAAFPAERERAFLDELFSLSGKWKGAVRSRKSYDQWVRRLFERAVFGPADLEALLESIRKDFAYGTAALENRLLVEIEEDARVARPELGPVAVRAEFDRLARDLAAHVARDLVMNVVTIGGGEAVSMLGLAALSAGGVLGPAVAGGGAAGFGAGLLLGLGAGLAIDWAVGDVFEDAARAELRRTTTELRNRIVDAVHASLTGALARYRELQERRVVALFDGRAHGGLAARP
jgi:hypothetical protein